MNTNGTHASGAGPNGLPGKDDADWSALRYVLGEMSVDEAEAFERTLVNDLEACERVASAAGLATTLYTALADEIESELATSAAGPTKSAPSAPARPGRRGLWAIVAAAAAVCVLAAGGLLMLPKTVDHDGIASQVADASAGSLVAIWSEQSAEISSDAQASGTEAERTSAVDGVAVADPDDDDDSVLIADGDYDVPGWMIAAVEKGNSWAPGTDIEIREN